MKDFLQSSNNQKLVIGQEKGQFIQTSNRIPKDFFVTSGMGESDITVHAGSYHLALKDAGIEPFNIMVYSSTLPAIANKIEKPKNLIHGCVMETIMACANSKKGKRATAAIIIGWLHDKVTGKKAGGFVCEYNGSLPEQKAIHQLRSSLNELYINGYQDKYDLKNIELLTKSFVPNKKYGTAIVALCFTSQIFPVLNKTF